MKIIIDGYNLINKDPDLRLNLKKSLYNARINLLNLLICRYAAKKIKIFLVFDSSIDGISHDHSAISNIKVIFSKPPESADDVICNILKREKNPKDCIVVTSDKKHIGQAAKSLGVKIITSEDFGKSLKPPENQNKEKPEITTLEELTEWLRYFGKI